MPRITVGYQDGTIHPLWLANAGMRMARLFGAQSLWVQDHYMGFIPAHVWKPEVTKAAELIHSPDAYFDARQILAVTATKMRGVDVGTLRSGDARSGRAQASGATRSAALRVVDAIRRCVGRRTTRRLVARRARTSSDRTRRAVTRA